MDRFLLAQVTDMHIKAGGQLSYRVVDTEGSLARCVAHIQKLPQRPDAILFTGDLTDFGRPEEYENLGRLIAPLPMPVYLMAGNHDEPDGLRKAFPGHAYLRQRSGHLDYVIDEHPVRIVALDSIFRGSPPERCAMDSSRGWRKRFPRTRKNPRSWPCTIRRSGPASAIWTTCASRIPKRSRR